MVRQYLFVQHRTDIFRHLPGGRLQAVGQQQDKLFTVITGCQITSPAGLLRQDPG